MTFLDKKSYSNLENYVRFDNRGKIEKIMIEVKS